MVMVVSGRPLMVLKRQTADGDGDGGDGDGGDGDGDDDDVGNNFFQIRRELRSSLVGVVCVRPRKPEILGATFVVNSTANPNAETA